MMITVSVLSKVGTDIGFITSHLRSFSVAVGLESFVFRLVFW